MSIVSKYKKLGPEIFFKKLLGNEAIFACAIRKKNIPLYEGNTKEAFNLIPISKDSWYADPLLYEYNGQTCLFMESWEYKTGKGVIVCCEIKDDSISECKTIIKEPFHMSFPNVFEFQDALYMIPETEESGGINLYRSVNFPYKWEKITYISTNYPVVDIVIESIENNTLYLQGSTFNRDDLLSTCFINFKLEFDDSPKFVLNEVNPFIKDMSYENRNAGRFIVLDEKHAEHCIQRSTQSIYGYSLKFIDSFLDKNHWIDKLNVLEILPDSISVKNWNKKIIGTHTYSYTDKYEAIDIQYFRWSAMNWVRQVKRRL